MLGALIQARVGRLHPVKQIRIVKQTRRREPQPLDLRTPSGRALPY